MIFLGKEINCMSEKKVLGIGALVTLFILVGGVLVLSTKSAGPEITTPIDAKVLEIDPENYDLGEVVMKDGLVNREYKVKNATDKTIKLKKIVTSCMCTKAKVKVGEQETKLFGMEGHGDKNAPVNIEIGAGEEALVTAVFDPAAHGPTGVGPFDRVITLTFSDPVGIVELKFSGKVV